MKITKSTEKLSKWSTRFADAGSAVIINGVPYDKQTNTPVPFNTMNIIGGSTMIADSVAGHGLMTGNNIEYEFKKEASPYLAALIDCNFESTLVDNQDSNITWSVTCSNPGNGLDGDNSSDGTTCYLDLDTNGNFTSTGSQIVVQKIIKNKDGTYSIITSSTKIRPYLNGLRVIYMTQDNDYVYVIANIKDIIVGNFVDTSGLSALKINKTDLTVVQSERYNGPMQAYFYGSSGYYQNTELRATTVLKEVESGLVILDRWFTNTADTYGTNQDDYVEIRGVETGGSSRYANVYRTIAYFYEFATNSWSKISIDGTPPLEIEATQSNYSTMNSALASSDVRKMCYAANSIDTGSTVEAYTIDYEAAGTADTKKYPDKCYKMVLQTGDTQTITSSEVTLNFGEGVDGITQFPVETFQWNQQIAGISYSSSYSTSKPIEVVLRDRSHIYATYVTKYDSTYYLHVVFKGYIDSSDYGIYVFELDSARTTATLVSVYKPENPTLIDIRFLDTSKKKIAMVDKLGYHFLNFDTEQKKWIKNMTVNTPVNYLVFTDENTAYAINVDRSMDMIKLNAAAQVGLTPEKTSYQYSGSDVDSFVNVWAKDSDGNYVAQTVRLTIDGDAVWKSNSLQTLETTTSAEGPTAIPFTIQGETVSNIGIDVIV